MCFHRNRSKTDHREIEKKLNHELALRKEMRRYSQLALRPIRHVLLN
jgi:hypothetical protein